jgi:rhamnosyltransferase subunit B
MSKIVIHTFGSLGDLNPYLALGKEIQNHGHHVTIATSDIYELNVIKQGFNFHLVRPNVNEYLNDNNIAKKAMDLKRGGEFIVKELLYANIEESYNDLYNICIKADLLITHSLCFAGPIVAEKLGMKWVSCALSPNVYMSVFDPSIYPISPIFQYLPKLGRRANYLFNSLTKSVVKSWAKPIFDFRKKINLPEGEDPIFKQLHSPFLSLALFSRHFAAKQIDWPSNVKTTGFCFFESNDLINIEFTNYLAKFSPDVTVTLGSASVHTPGDFYSVCSDVLNDLGLNAVFLLGENHLSDNDKTTVNNFYCNYLPFNNVFNNCKLIINQGGIGTIAQVLKSGTPMLGIPFSHDQPDNTIRMKRMGIGEVIYKENMTHQNLKKSISKIFNSYNIYKQNAEFVSKFIKQENGTLNAYYEIAKVLNMI